MELFFLVLLVVVLACALGSGYPAAFAIPGSAILTIGIAAFCGYVYAGGINTFFVHGGGPDAWLSAGVLNFRGNYRSDSGDTLIAIPLFIFMGLMLQRSKVAEDLLLAMAQLFRAIRGGLGISVIIVGALLAATTGIVGATVVTMGMISLPTMLQNRYSKPLATGVVAATGTLGQIIPPSIVLLILVHQLTTAVNQANAGRRALYKVATGELTMPSEFDVFSVSAGEMFMGAFVPGMVLVGLYILYVTGAAVLRPSLAPTMPRDETGARDLFLNVIVALVPPLTLILLVLGSIVTGVATVNQAGAIGAAGATIMAGYRLYRGRRGAFAPTLLALFALVAIALILRNFDVNLRKIYSSADVVGLMLSALAAIALATSLIWSGWRTLKVERTMQYVMDETLKTTSLVFAILLGAVMLTAAFRGFGGEDLVKGFLQTLPGGFWGQFTIVMLIVFLLGFFLDFIEITVVVVPIVAPILLADPSANIAAVWLGVMIALVIQTSFLTPPFGFALFYLRGVAPVSVRTIDIYKGVVPFIGLQLLALAVVGGYPALVTYLPNRILLQSDNAPPTSTPRLQYCIEAYVSRQFRENGDALRAAIDRARSLDLTPLPPKYRADLTKAFDKAGQAFPLMNAIETSEVSVAEAATGYTSVHARVRQLQRDARLIDKEISKLQTLVSRAGRTVSEEDAQKARERLTRLTVRRDAILAEVPSDWETRHSDFAAIQTAESTARRTYRRDVDEAYQPVAELIALIGDGDKLAAVSAKLPALEEAVQSEPPADLVERIETVRSALSDIDGTSAIYNALSKVRRALRAKVPDRETALAALADATAQVEAERHWRSAASGTLLAGLKAYRATIADTIGLRSQEQLPRSIAATVAACVASPRHIFLYF